MCVCVRGVSDVHVAFPEIRRREQLIAVDEEGTAACNAPEPTHTLWKPFCIGVHHLHCGLTTTDDVDRFVLAGTELHMYVPLRCENHRGR